LVCMNFLEQKSQFSDVIYSKFNETRFLGKYLDLPTSLDFIFMTT